MYEFSTISIIHKSRKGLGCKNKLQTFFMVGRLAFSGRELWWVHNSTNENRIRKSTAAVAAAELMNDWNVVESASSAKKNVLLLWEYLMQIM